MTKGKFSGGGGASGRGGGRVGGSARACAACRCRIDSVYILGANNAHRFINSGADGVVLNVSRVTTSDHPPPVTLCSALNSGKWPASRHYSPGR